MIFRRAALVLALPATLAFSSRFACAQPDDGSIMTPLLRDGAQKRAQEAQEAREKQERRTPLGALWQFVNGINDGDLWMAARNVEGATQNPDVTKLANLQQPGSVAQRWPLQITPLWEGAEKEPAPAAPVEFEARIGVSYALDGPLRDEWMLAAKTAWPERVTLRRRKDGEWKIVPRPAPPRPERPKDESAAERTRSFEAALKAAAGEEDGILNVWARAIAQPRPLLEHATSRASMSRVKQVLLGIMQLAQDYDEKLAFDVDNFQEKVLPYVRDKSLFNAPALDEAEDFAYVLNPSLAGKGLAQLDEPARTVAVYEGAPDGKMLFRFGGRSIVGFADGHVAFVTPEQAKELVWQIGAPQP